jgi:HK97 family phage portal protein
VSFWQRLLGRNKQASEAAATLIHPVASATFAGKKPPTRNAEELMRAYKTHPWLRAVVHRVATSVASVSWYLEAPVRGNGRAYRWHALQRADVETRVTLRKQDVELQRIDQHPMLAMLERGNPMLSGYEVFQTAQTHMDLKGEAFLGKVRNATGMPVSLWPFPPHWVRDIPTAQRPTYEVRAGAGTIMLPTDDVLWLKDPDPQNPYGRGTGIAEALADEIDTDEYAAKYTKAYFYNHAMPDQIVGLPGASPDRVRGLQAEWNQRFRGPNKAHGTLFINSEIDVNEVSATLNDQSVVELRRELRDFVRQVYGVPPEILGIVENSNRATIEAASFIFALYVLQPRAERWRMVMQADLAPDYDERLIIDYESVVPADKEFILESAKTQPYALTRGEWRTMAGQSPHDEGDDVYLQPLDLFERPAGDAEAQLPQDDAGTGERAASCGCADCLTKTTPVDPHALIENTLNALNPEYLSEPTLELWSTELAALGDSVLADLGVNMSFDMLNPLTVQHLRELKLDQIEGFVDATSRDRLRATLLEGVQAGEGTAELVKRVRGEFGYFSDVRAENIARTEVGRSANFGTYQSHRISGVVEWREWIATADSRTRKPHADVLDGKRARLNEPFRVGNKTAMYPGGFGVPELDNQCRCATVPFFPELETDFAPHSKQLAAWRKTVNRWRKKHIRVLRKAFKRQQKDVIAALRGE